MDKDKTALINNTVIEWKSSFFSSSYKLYKDDEKLGHLKDKNFSSIAHAEFKDIRLKFKAKGFFNKKVIISNEETEEELGLINFSTWYYKAKIQIGEEEYKWAYDNLWNTRWSLTQNDSIVVEGKSKSFKGTISYKTNDSIAMLAALYIAQSFSKKTIIITILVVIIIAS